MLKRVWTKNKKLSDKQSVLIESLEGIGDILVFETRRQKNKLVLEWLQKITDIIKKIFDIKENDPEKFEQLVFSQEILEFYKKDEKDAKFLLAFDPEKYLISFSTAINQVTRVYEAAVDSQNEEISRFAVYHINWILARLTKRPNNDLFVEQILRKLSEISRIAIERNDKSMYAASIHWYIDVVFNHLGRKEGDFDLTYIDLFNEYFFSMVKYIVSEDQKSLFHALVSYLVDGINIPFYNQGKVWEYGHLILHSGFEIYKKLDEKYDIEKKIKELVSSETDVATKDKLDIWFKKFNELKAIIEPNLKLYQRKEAKKLEKEIKEFILSQFKYNNLLEIIFTIGAYCLFKQRASYIKYLWEYKQPPDADALWIGHDIVPTTLDEVIRLYFKRGIFKRKFDFWEGHHGSEKYYKQYFLLLLARVLQNVRADSEGSFPQIENYKLPDLHIFVLSNLEYSVDEFIQLATDLKTQKSLLAELGFDIKHIDELFDGKLIPFLKKLKEEASKQISVKNKSQNISLKKIEEFKEDFLKSFYESASLRDIFINYLKLYEDRTREEKVNQKQRFEINIVDDKAAFFDEWHIHYAEWGKNYGRSLAFSENSYLFDAIAKSCEEISKEEFENTLSKFKNTDDIVIFAANIAFWLFFKNCKNFKPKWYRNVKQLDIKSFEGWYEFNGKFIPIFKIYHQNIEKQILILNRNKIGRIIQLSPLNEGENESLVRDIFYINIQAFSENKKLMEYFIKKSPEWLKKIGDEQKQREYLQKRVLIQIFERFEYSKPRNFEGYKLVLKE